MAQNDRQPRRDDDRAEDRIQSYDDPAERPARDTEDWLEAIGPEDMDRDRVIQNLEQYGFDIMDDDDELSLESDDQEFGGGYANGAYTDIEEVGDRITHDTPLDAEQELDLRPTEEEVIDELDDEDETLDDEMPSGGTQPSGLQ